MRGDFEEKPQYIAALDIGTTTIRCIIFNHLCQIIGSSYTNVKLIYPQYGHVEIDPNELWDSTVSVIRNAVLNAKIEMKDIASLGISTQRASFITWTKNNNHYLHNFITWKDIRAKSLANRLNNRLKIKILQWISYFIYLILRIKKLLVFSNLKFTCSHASVRLVWALENLEELKDNVKKQNVMFGTLDTWLLYKLTCGRLFVSDVSNACSTGFYDPFDFKWSIVASLLNIPEHILPPVVRNDYDFGTTDESIFGHPINIGCVISDQSASLYGSCCFNDNDLKVTLGTGGFVNVNTSTSIHPSTEGMYSVIAWQLRDEIVYMTEAACNDVGSVIQWMLNAELIQNPAQSSDLASSVQDNNGVYFISAFGGLGVPINDEKAAAGFIGIKPTTNRVYLVRAALESIVFRIALCYELLNKQRQRNYKHIVVDGGVSKNNFICQRLADVTGINVVRLESAETTARGVGFLVGLKLGIWKDQSELEKYRKIEIVFEPTKIPQKLNKRERHLSQWYEASMRFKSWYD